MDIAVVVMAAGMGTRMKSKLPKVLHPILGKPLLSYALDAVEPLDPVKTAVIVGHEADQVEAQIRKIHADTGQSVSFVRQSPQLGTGHAVQQAQSLLQHKSDLVFVTYGDMPLITHRTLQRLKESFVLSEPAFVLLTVEADDPRGFGRIVRDANGLVQAIIEEADCTPEQKAIRELNVGAYVFRADWLWKNLEKVPLSAKGEYYLTDLVEIAVQQGQPVQAEVLTDITEAIGVNTRVHLAEAEATLRRRINQQWLESGVTMIDPATTHIGCDVVIEPDTVIYPNTYLLGNTSIGADCIIGPGSFVEDSVIGNGCTVRFSVIEEAILEDDVDVGPFSHLRRGAHLATGVHMGNFGEVKNSYLGPGTKMGHFSYLGDATTGVNVNIGAGTITCNYDGVSKNRTVINDDAFIGSDTMLVAPVTIGKNAKTGAGSVVNRDIPPDSLAYGVPARVKNSAAQ